MPPHAEVLLRFLQQEREHLVGTLDGLSEYDVRRPMTPSGTSLLGLVKHVASVELGYPAMSTRVELALRSTASRGPTATPRSAASAWTLPRACPGGPWRSSATTVGHLVVRMVAETAHHAGHAELLREAIVAR